MFQGSAICLLLWFLFIKYLLCSNINLYKQTINKNSFIKTYNADTISECYFKCWDDYVDCVAVGFLPSEINKPNQNGLKCFLIGHQENSHADEGTIELDVFVTPTKAASKKYFYSTERLSWKDANEDCKKRGMMLTTILSDEENDIIWSGIKERYCATNVDQQLDAVWIGFNDINVEGKFEWVVQSAKSYHNWGFGEPNNNGPSAEPEHCVQVFRGSGKWNDYICVALLHYVCKNI